MANPSTPQEQKIQQHRERLERLRSIQIGKQGAQTEPASPKVIVAQAVKREYPTLPYDEVQKATRELVLAPRKATVKVGKEEIPVEDLQFKIAESIEIINSETTSSQEYFSWFEDCAEIMRNMNDGYINLIHTKSKEPRIVPLSDTLILGRPQLTTDNILSKRVLRSRCQAKPISISDTKITKVDIDKM